MAENDPSEKDLRRLYVDEGKTEKEIANLFGTYQVRIGRLRSKYGIETVSKSERLKLPPLTARQRALLMGSMLGDGRLFETGASAAFSEYHSLEQEEYLRWKAQEWGPYVKSIRPATKRGIDGKEYKGLILRTHGCQALLPYWKTYYPSGSGNKTFVKSSTRLTAFALAIWYLDDGSKTWNGYARFAVTPVEEDIAFQMSLLESLGLDPSFHENLDGSDSAIWIHNRTALSKFIDLISPHIPPCMSYKIDFKARSRGTAPRHLLTQETLQPFVDQGWGANRIAKALAVSVNAARSALDRQGFARPALGRPPQVEGQVTFESAKKIISCSTLEEDQLVDLLLKVPHPESPSLEAAQRDWNRLRDIDVDLNRRPGNQGQKLCQHFFPYRFEATYESLPSLNRGWYDPKWVRKAIRFQKSVGDPVLPMNVHRALRAILRCPTNFRPALAKAIVQEYCPEGGLVLDPCAGYGGRVTGTLAARRKYYGVDPHPQAGSAYGRLREVIGDFQFENCSFEEASLKGVEADLVFTSPPYYSKERYSDDVGQSWVRYPLWDQWMASSNPSLNDLG